MASIALHKTVLSIQSMMSLSTVGHGFVGRCSGQWMGCRESKVILRADDWSSIVTRDYTDSTVTNELVLLPQCMFIREYGLKYFIHER